MTNDSLGPYRLLDKLGEGAMGSVYRATDTGLSRQVAIKVLPEEFAADPDRLARFEREATILAALNHAHIAAIYAVERSSGRPALVMELVEGEDLSRLIARGPIPVDEALSLAGQIAEALDAAHEQGIVHRDLKPANIKVRSDGTVKVLDFGLAKALDSRGGRAVQSRPGDVTQSPTIASPAEMTGVGAVLGTAAYMAPEQARGKPVDKRADIWAFGAVLFEMLSGQRAFAGIDVAETLANVLRTDPAWETLPADVPIRVRQVLRSCLQRDAKQRIGDMQSVRLALEGAFETHMSPPPPPITTTWWGGRIGAALMAATALAAGTAMPTLRHLTETPVASPSEMRLDVTTPATPTPLQFALSPDGRAIVLAATGDGPSRLWLRSLDESEARPLPGTEGGAAPFWAPDSRSIGFFSAGRLLRIDLGAGPPQVLVAESGAALGGSWSTDGTILFARRLTDALWKVGSTGGEPVLATRLARPQQIGHRYPQFLPDGRTFLFFAEGAPDTSGIYLGSLDGGAPTLLTAGDASGAFLPPDWLLYSRQGSLVARRLDLARRELTGESVTLAERVSVGTYGGAGYAVSRAGLIAFRADASSRQLVWVDRSGKLVGNVGEPDGGGLQWPELSPDGQRVAMRRATQGNTDVWLQDLFQGGMTRLTFDPAGDGAPVWSPDGTRVAFGSNRNGGYNLYVKSSNGSGNEESLTDSPSLKVPHGWSADGRWLLYSETNSSTGSDLRAVDMSVPAHTSLVVADTAAQELLGQFSPDGRWVAYQSNESGRFEIVVQTFPERSGRWQVSTNGGVAPRWRADGKELYFLSPNATLMAAHIEVAGGALAPATVAPLFPARIVEGAAPSGRPQYAVARDGRFLINRPADDAVAPITLILNWSGRPPARNR